MTMRNSLIGLLSGVCVSAVATESLEDQAHRIARENLIIDTHIDVPFRIQKKWDDVSIATESGDFDYPRAIKGGLNAPFMSIYIPAGYEAAGTAGQLADTLIDQVEALVGRAPDKFALAYRSSDLERDFKAGKISLAMGMENGAPIAGDLKNLHHYFERGIRYITLAHSRSNHISDSSYDLNRQWGGLSPFGKTLVREMNQLGVMVDVSHISDDAMFQVLQISQAPVIASHSSVRKYTPGWERNMSDEMIKAMGKHGSVIQINFGSSFINPGSNLYQQAFGKARQKFMDEGGFTDRNAAEVVAFSNKYREKLPFKFATLEDVLKNIDHVVELAGIDHVGIGSDYDGVGDSLPEELKDVAAYPNLIQALLKRGYTEEQVEKVLYKNLLRVWQAVEVYAQAKG